MEIRSVNINESTTSNDKVSQPIDHNDHVSDKESDKMPDKSGESAAPIPADTKAVFAIDENKHVVIQLVNEEGDVIRQIPPEDYLEMLENLKIDLKSHYDIVA